MSTNLQQAVKTSKVSTLPDDLKAIAEAMLADKFGEEVVEQQVPDPFHGNKPDGFDAGYFDTIDITELTGRDGSKIRVSSEFLDRIRQANRGYLDEITLTSDFRSRRPKARLSVSNPHMDGLASAVRRFRELNIRYDMMFVMNPDFANEMMHRDRDFSYYFQRNDNRRRREGERDVYGQIMGIDVVITPEVYGCLLEGVF